MYNMKRLIVIALLATMMIGVTGCGNSKTQVQVQQLLQPKVPHNQLL